MQILFLIGRLLKNLLLPSPGRQLIFFSIGRCANENLNSVGGHFERNLNLLVVGDFEYK
jgi:hypothetical protein